MTITKHEFEQAEHRMQSLRQHGHAIAARYDNRSVLALVVRARIER
jgi:hypothetical protein